MEVNYFGVIRLTNLIVKQMIEDNRMCRNTSHRPEFAIVNIGSVQSILAIPYRSAYAASKHALMAYTDSLRYELHDHANINAINVYPGYINTNISVNALRDDGNTNNENDDDHRHAYSPNYVAKRTINSILNHDKEVFISVFLHRVAVWLRFFLPNFYHYLMFKRAASKAKANAKYA
jgi:dehydrogenase/reductase SDR family protein 7B